MRTTDKPKGVLRVCWILMALCLVCSGQRAGALTKDEALSPISEEIGSRAALVVDMGTGDFLYEKNAHTRQYPASLTKIMTTLLVLEHGTLTDSITAGETAFGDLDAAGSTQNIQPGETMTVRELLLCTMVSSANEACNVLAEYIAGDVPSFVKMMNDRALSLGCENTNFVNTHGLHDEQHYTTASDLYLITREAMTHPEFMEIANTAATSIPPTNKSGERTLYTTNHLISNKKDGQYLYYAAKGVKTGFTTPAGHCLVSSAEEKGLTLCSVVLGAPKEEGDGGRVRSFVETKALLMWAFDNFTTKTLLKKSDQIDEVAVLLGKDHDGVKVNPQASLEALVPQTLTPEDVERTVTLYDGGEVTAPVTKGQVLGEITLSWEGTVFGTVPLVASDAVERDETERIVQEVKGFLSQPWLWYTIAGLVFLILLYVILVIRINSVKKRERGRSNYRGGGRRR